MERPEMIVIEVPSRLVHLDWLQEAAEKIAALAGFDDDGCLDLGLAVREGAINAMKHAHAFDASLPVRVEFVVRVDALEIRVLDRGPGFDPEATPDPTAPENLLRTSGRGLLLIRSLVDEVRIERRAQGMQVTLVRARPQPVDGASAGEAG
ncbi:MAG: hypothetical protein Kow0062_26500 [Acidobacteriota bacterium]|nr:MAG: ATP-binding protein [Acidobacteriota bacterium]